VMPDADAMQTQPLRLTPDVPEEKSEPAPPGSNTPRIDIGAVITKALTAAGLMKDR